MALVFAALWWTSHPPRPQHPTGDLYSHLSVARHLVRGEGFRTDMAYPLSFAWDFARELPQPLVHRPPGFALLLTVPHLAAGGDPGRTLAAVRLLQLVLLTAVAWLGSAAWFARKRPGAALGWLVLLGTNPLLAFAVDWGHVELVAALLLLAIWLRRREGMSRLGPVEGLLLGTLGLLRPELVLVPVVWWVVGWRGPRPTARALAAFLAAFLLLTSPWALRNAVLTGNPFFSIQAQAEHVKDTTSFPGYSVYRGLAPQPLLTTLRDDPVPVLRKIARGGKFFWREGRQLAPWPLLIIPFAGVVLLLRKGRLRFSRRRRGVEYAEPLPEDLTGWGLIAGTLVLLVGFYAAFDHTLRHLEVLLPILLWETGPLLAEVPARGLPARLGRLVGRPWVAAAVAMACATGLVLLAPARPTGWNEAAAGAVRGQTLVRDETARLKAAPLGVVFVKTSAAPWFADRPAVWDPDDEAVREAIRAYLAAGPASP